MSQVAFLIVFLFTFRKRKSVSAFGASDLDVWHVADSPRVRNLERSTLLLFETWSEPSCLVSLGLRQDEVANECIKCSIAIARIPKRSSGVEFTPVTRPVQTIIKLKDGTGCLQVPTSLVPGFRPVINIPA
jgi:hypothetical protein